MTALTSSRIYLVVIDGVRGLLMLQSSSEVSQERLHSGYQMVAAYVGERRGEGERERGERGGGREGGRERERITHTPVMHNTQ